MEDPYLRGECCRQNLKTLHSSAVPLTELRIGESVRVAYIRCERDDQLHRLDSLCIRPGGRIKLHQKYPAYVIECERGNIAIEESVASNIHVWVRGDQIQASLAEMHRPWPGRGRRRRWRFKRGLF